MANLGERYVRTEIVRGEENGFAELSKEEWNDWYWEIVSKKDWKRNRSGEMVTLDLQAVINDRDEEGEFQRLEDTIWTASPFFELATYAVRITPEGFDADLEPGDLLDGYIISINGDYLFVIETAERELARNLHNDVVKILSDDPYRIEIEDGRIIRKSDVAVQWLLERSDYSRLTHPDGKGFLINEIFLDQFV